MIHLKEQVGGAATLRRRLSTLATGEQTGLHGIATEQRKHFNLKSANYTHEGQVLTSPLCSVVGITP